MILLDSLFAGGLCTSAVSSCAGSREVTMSFPSNARRPCLAKHTNVLIVASLPYPLSCDPSFGLILASPSVSQNLLATSTTFFLLIRVFHPTLAA
jgi:hypothetical protein